MALRKVKSPIYHTFYPYIHIFINVSVYACMCICINVCGYVCAWVCIYIFVYVCVWVCMRVYMCVYMYFSALSLNSVERIFPVPKSTSFYLEIVYFKCLACKIVKRIYIYIYIYMCVCVCVCVCVQEQVVQIPRIPCRFSLRFDALKLFRL